MAVRDFAITPKGILSALRRIAPNVSIETNWSEDADFIWDGEGPDPAEAGYFPHTVEVVVTVETDDGEPFSGADFLGGTYARPGVEDPNVSGYFPQMLEMALKELYLALVEKKVFSSRKRWDPREADVDPERSELATEVRAAVRFVKRSMEEIYNREQRRRGA